MNSELAWIKTTEEISGCVISECGRAWLTHEDASQHPIRPDILFLADFSGSDHGVGGGIC